MATSGDTTYSITRDNLITEALKHIGVIEEGGSASATQLSDCLPKLQMMVKALSIHGMNLWKRTTVTIDPLILNQAAYTIGPAASSPDETGDKPLRIYTATIKDSNNNEIPLIPLSLQEYEALSDKTSSGKPVQYYFNPGRIVSTVTLWPVPDATAVANDTIDIVYHTYAEDMDGATDDFDFPSEWSEALMLNLAKRIAPMYGYPLEERYLLNREAKNALDLVLSWDTEDGSVFLRPETKRK